MFLILSFLVLAVGLDFLAHNIAWLTPTVIVNFVAGAAANTAAVAINNYVIARNWIFPRLRNLAIALGVYLILLTFAIVLQSEWFTFFVIMVGVPPLFVSMYALRLLTLPLDVAAEKLREFGTWLAKVPASITLPSTLNPAGAATPVNGAWRLLTSILLLPINAIYIPFALPIKAAAGVVEGVGAIVEFASELAKKLVRVMRNVTLLLLVMAVACLLDVRFDWHIMDPWTVAYLSLGLGIYIAMGIEHDDVPVPIRIMARLAYVGLALLIANDHLTWIAFTRNTFVYVTYPPLAICLAETLGIAAILFFARNGGGLDAHGHPTAAANPIKTILIGSTLVLIIWGVQYPWMTSDQPTYVWTQRLIHFQFWRLNNVNTNQTQDETDPLVGAAENNRKVPSNFAIATTFESSSQRAHDLDMQQKAWEATAKGQTLPHPPREIRGNTWHWIQTDIAVYSCMKITASGKIWRDGGTDPAAGPDGEDYFINPLHANKTTVVSGLRWGTFIGKVCDEQDKKGDQCGTKMPIGSVAYRSPNQIIAGQQVGAGRLWVWTNQFGTETDRSDYNIGQGGFTFDAEPAPADMCDTATTVASR